MKDKKWQSVSIADICKAYGLPLTRPSSQPMDDKYSKPFLAPRGASIGLLKR